MKWCNACKEEARASKRMKPRDIALLMDCEVCKPQALRVMDRWYAVLLKGSPKEFDIPPLD